MTRLHMNKADRRHVERRSALKALVWDEVDLLHRREKAGSSGEREILDQCIAEKQMQIYVRQVMI